MNLNNGLPLPDPCYYCDMATQSITSDKYGGSVYVSCTDNGGCSRRRRWCGRQKLMGAMDKIRAHFVGVDPAEIEADIDAALQEVRNEAR